MDRRPLGKTGIRISPVALGAGPVAALLTGADRAAQTRVVERAIALGVNWFDTAPTYGNGASEANLAAAIADLGAGDQVHIATKVRIEPRDAADAAAAVERTVRESLARLRTKCVTLLQLHNAITEHPGGEPMSLSPSQVLSPGGALDALVRAQQLGLCEHIGLTGIGSPAALAEVLATGKLATIQTPLSLSSPAAEDLLAACRRHGVAVLAIRVFAAGALSGQEPSEHTRKTPFFPLAIYERDQRLAARMEKVLPEGMSLKEAAVRYVVGHGDVTSAIVGIATDEQVEEVIGFAARGPLPPDLLAALLSTANEALASEEPAS